MISEDDVFRALKVFIASTVPDGMRVLRTPINRAPMPTGGFVAMTPGRFKPLATNSSTTDATTRVVRQPQQFECQIDCYGATSCDVANKIVVLFRDQFAADSFAASGIELAPLYADDAQQMPIVNGEDQYEERWTCRLVMQINQMVSTGQQSANMVTVDLIDVDSTYPPTT